MAEGVENAQVWDRLCALGCDVAQGFAIARPMSLPDLRTWVTARRRPDAAGAAASQP